MAQWQSLGPDAPLSDIQAAVDKIDAILGAIEAALKILTTAIEVVGAFAVTTINLLESIVAAVVAALEDFVLDLLEYNGAFCFHMNVNWNPKWTYDRTGEDDPNLVDWKIDNELPWHGSGLVGWLLDVLVSAQDPTDPFRPVTDDNTDVTGVVVVFGVPNSESLSDFQDIFEIFTNFTDLKVDAEKVRNAVNGMKSMAKAGPAAFDEFTGSLLKSKDELIGTVTLLDDALLERKNDEFFPFYGVYPKWLSVPFAALIPPIQSGFEALRKLLGLLKPALNLRDSIAKLVAALKAKIQQLEELIERIEDLLEFIVGFITVLASASIVSVSTSGGGMNEFIGTALAADDRPDFGTAGLVAGFCLVATSPDLSATLEKFLRILGIELSAYSSGNTERAELLADTFDEQFP